MPAHSLEQEAMERVRRMYAPFDRDPGSRQPDVRARQEKAKEEKPEPAAEPEKPIEAKEPVRNDGMIDLLMKDKDRSLIMLLLVIMVKDGADMNAILALVYLLL